jgi:hypothetical protein
MKLNSLRNEKNKKLNVNKYMASLGDEIGILWKLRQQIQSIQLAQSFLKRVVQWWNGEKIWLWALLMRPNRNVSILI